MTTSLLFASYTPAEKQTKLTYQGTFGWRKTCERRDTPQLHQGRRGDLGTRVQSTLSVTRDSGTAVFAR